MKKLLGIVVLGLFLSMNAYAKIVNKTFQFNCNNVFDSETRAIVTITFDDKTGEIKKGKATLLRGDKRSDYENLISDSSSIGGFENDLYSATFIEKSKTHIWGFQIEGFDKTSYELYKFQVGDYKTKNPYILTGDATDRLKCIML